MMEWVVFLRVRVSISYKGVGTEEFQSFSEIAGDASDSVD